jgi:hypothetical protein
MEDPEDFPVDPDEFIRAWHEYGLRFSVFVPDQQPKPDTWEPDVQEFDKKGLVNPHYFKHWKYFAPTKDFLRQRYAEYRILQGPTLFFDCLVPQFHNPMRHGRIETEYGPDFFDVKDTSKWYERVIRMGIFDWKIGFSCRSVMCQRSWRALHRGNPNRTNPVSIYGLPSVFERIPDVTANVQVAEWFGVKLGDLKSTGKRSSSRWRRRVSKQAFYDLVKEYDNMRNHHVKELVGRLHPLIMGSPSVEWHRRLFDGDYAFISDKAASNLCKIKGPAAKAYVWLFYFRIRLAFG